MSDTPRTDAKERETEKIGDGRHSHYGWKMARTLERELAVVTAERDALRRAHDAVLALINDSRGVVGLHLNGDEASWDELRTGGRFEEWLSPFDDALRGKEVA